MFAGFTKRTSTAMLWREDDGVDSGTITIITSIITVREFAKDPRGSWRADG